VKSMKIVSLSTSWQNGGAAIAAKQINNCLAVIDGCRVIEISQELFANRHKNRWLGNLLRLYFLVRRKIGRALCFFDDENRLIYRSYSILPSRILDEIRVHSPDIVHLHWVQGEFLSVEDIGKIRVPIVWTLHDAWPISMGAAHHQYEDIANTGNMEVLGCGLLTKWMGWRKKRSWSRVDLTIVSPSRWMYEKSLQSSLCKGARCKLIPNAIDLQCFKPRDVFESRKRLGLPENGLLMLVGSMAGEEDPVKGVDLLLESLRHVECYGDLTILAIGNVCLSDALKMNCISLPLINSRLDMSYVYSAADITCVPSRIETHSMMAAESVCCHTPVIAFNIAGNPSVIDDNETGYLVKPFSTKGYADAICNALEKVRCGGFSYSQFERSRLRWDQDSVAKQYHELYREIIRGAVH